MSNQTLMILIYFNGPLILAQLINRIILIYQEDLDLSNYLQNSGELLFPLPFTNSRTAQIYTRRPDQFFG